MSMNLLPDFFNRPLRQLPSLIPNALLNQWLNLFEENLPQELATRGVRIYEDDTHLHVEIPIPGLDSKDIEVTLNNGVLLVRGGSTEEEKDKKRKYFRYSKRDYTYSLALPTQIDEKQEPQADYTDGILKVSLQLAKSKETKKIPVKSSKKK